MQGSRPIKILETGGPIPKDFSQPVDGAASERTKASNAPTMVLNAAREKVGGHAVNCSSENPNERTRHEATDGHRDLDGGE